MQFKSITLSQDEMIFCSNAGDQIEAVAVSRGLRTLLGEFGNHQVNCMAQCAFAKLRGVEWHPTIVAPGDPVDKTKLALVDGYRIRVRTEHWHDLIVRDNDEDTVNLVLCIAKPPEFRFIGYVDGKTAKQKSFVDRAVLVGRCFSPLALNPITDLETNATA